MRKHSVIPAPAASEPWVPSSATRPRDDQAGGLYTLRTTVLATALFALANAAVRLFAGTRLSMDDAKTNLFTQAWQWGYQADNPPLFEWLIILLRPLTGGGIWSFLLLKTLALIAAAAFLHLAVRRMAGEREAACTALGMVLLYQIGWNYFQAFTHSALLVSACCAGLWTGIGMVQTGRVAWFASFGLALGLGVLTKYNYLLFALPFLLASLTLPGFRRALLRPGALLILLIALPVALPHASWLTERPDAYGATLQGTLGLAGTRGERLLSGAEALIVATVSFFLPWLLVAGWLGRERRMKLTEAENLLVRTSAIGLVLIGIGVLFGVGDVSERYVIPVLLPAYAGMTSALMRRDDRNGRAFLIASAAFAVAFTAFRFLGLAVAGPPFCEDCRDFIPYEVLIDRLAEVTPEGSVYLVHEENTAGNLVAAFPRAKIRSMNLLPMMNPTDEVSRPCYFVWSEDMVGGVPLEGIFAYAQDDPHTVHVEAHWTHPFKEKGFRTTEWGITPITDPHLYAQFCTPHDG